MAALLTVAEVVAAVMPSTLLPPDEAACCSATPPLAGSDVLTGPLWPPPWEVLPGPSLLCSGSVSLLPPAVVAVEVAEAPQKSSAEEDAPPPAAEREDDP